MDHFEHFLTLAGAAATGALFVLAYLDYKGKK